jgi:hypothetical protein
MNKVRAFAAVLFTLLLAGASICQTQTTSKPLDKSKYKTVVVEKFEVGDLANQQNFPTGYTGILQKTTVLRLQKSFEKVIDGTDQGSTPAEATAELKGRLLLSASVIGYDKGSRTARWMVGMGAGSSKVMVRFIFRDAETGQEAWRADEQGAFAGTFNVGGGSEDKAVSESSRKVVENLVKDLASVR